MIGQFNRRNFLVASAASLWAPRSSLAQTGASLIGTGQGGWDNATMNIDGQNFKVQHAWANATYGQTSHGFPCYGGAQGAECYPGTTYCANPASLFRFSDLQQAPSPQIPIDMVLAILVCSGVRETDPYKWRINYDCTPNVGCNPSPNQWAQGDCSGLFYGFDGVCHQAANRILAATNLCADTKCSIDHSKTYVLEPFPTGMLSWLTYGFLGWDIDWFWQMVQDRYYGRSTMSAREADERLVQVHFERSTDIALRRPIISHYILEGAAADAAKTEAVEQAVKAYLLEKHSLDSDLVSGAAKPQAFAFEVNGRAAAMLKRLGEIVGETWYRKYDFPGAVLNFVSPLWMADAEQYRRFAHLAPARPDQ